MPLAVRGSLRHTGPRALEALHRHPLLSALLLAAVVTATLLLALTPRFETNDDIAMQAVVDGTLTGRPQPDLIVTNVVVGLVAGGAVPGGGRIPLVRRLPVRAAVRRAGGPDLRGPRRPAGRAWPGACCCSAAWWRCSTCRCGSACSSPPPPSCWGPPGWCSSARWPTGPAFPGARSQAPPPWSGSRGGCAGGRARPWSCSQWPSWPRPCGGSTGAGSPPSPGSSWCWRWDG